jgi:hypothetical protein
MRRILIGYGTSLGKHLASRGGFSELFTYRRALAGLPHCDEIVLVVPSSKRLAGGDLGIAGAGLVHVIKGMAKRLVALSTLAVYPVKSLPFDEDSVVNTGPPGTNSHLLAFEQMLLSAVQKPLILRLPEVFGPGFDRGVCNELLKDDEARINRIAIHQLYPVNRLEKDIIIARHLGVPAVNLCPQPLSMEALLVQLFPGEVGYVEKPAHYSRIRTRYGETFGGRNGYIMSAESVMEEVRLFVQVNRQLRIRGGRANQAKTPAASFYSRAATR